MELTDSILLEILFIVAIFGALPVAYVTRANDEEYKTFGFVIGFIVSWGILGVIGQLWPLLFFIPASWYFALKPVLKKHKG